MTHDYLLKCKIIMILTFFSFVSFGQYLEEFEDEVDGAKQFTSNGQTFNVGLNWEIENFTNYGYKASDYYIDNFSNCSVGAVGSISTSDGTDIHINSFWLYAATSCGSSRHVGDVIISGFKDDVEVLRDTFEVRTTSPSPFPQSNGFDFIDFDSELYSCIAMDSLLFETTDFNYLALDHITWSPSLITPSISAIIASEDTICLGDQVTLTAQEIIVGTAGTLDWRTTSSNQGNSLGDSDTLVISPDQTTTYYLASEGCDTAIESFTITVPAVPNLSEITVSEDSICPGESISLYPENLELGYRGSFDWQVNGQSISTDTTLLTSPDTTTTYYAVLEGCENINLGKTIYVSAGESIVMLMSDDDSICAGSSVLLSAQINTGFKSSFSWRTAPNGAGSEIGTTSDVLVTPTEKTSYYAIIEGCDTIQDSISIHATMVDNSIDVSGNILTALDENADLQWIDCENDEIYEDSTNQSFIVQETGYYAVELSNAGCVDTSECTQVIITSIQNTIDQKFDIYPNPASEVLHIVTGNNSNYTITIHDAIGNAILAKTFNTSGISIDLSGIQQGIYTVQLKSKTGLLVQQFHKE